MPVAKPEWGKKRTCQNCGAKYYDMRTDPPVCPKCETVFQKETNQSGRRNRSAPEAPKAISKAASAAVTVEVDEEGLEDDTLENDEAVPEDTSDLGGDDEDMSDGIDNVETERDEG